MLRDGVYRKRNPVIGIEEHGGARIKYQSLFFLAFYLSEEKVGWYGGKGLWFQPYLKKQFRYSGMLMNISKNMVTFYINDPYNNDKILFTGTISGDIIHLVSYRESNPNTIWLEDDFEYIGKGNDESKI